MSKTTRNMKVALDSLGCKLNQAEIELLAGQFIEAGYSLVSPHDTADVFILNTCTVTHVADSKSRHWLKSTRRRNPGAVIIATGCYAERMPQELTNTDGSILILGNQQKPHLLRMLENSGCLNNACRSQMPSVSSGNNTFRTRAFIKIQDGCGNYCTYCVVPLVRAGEESVPVDQVLAEVKAKVSDDHKELVLTGIKIGSYDHNGVNLKELLERILAETNVTRLRLSSLQPQEISAGLIKMWQDHRLCRHFHLSLQSGSDPVLRRMKRRYSTSDYEQAVTSIRSRVPEVAISTDVIVGFPGETTTEFEQSYNFCQQMNFARIHVFAYSPRQGTEAAQMPQQIGDKIKKHRSQKMLALAKESARNFGQRFSGITMPALWEKQSDDGIWSGLTDNYIRVYTKSDDDLTNRLLPLKLD